MNKARKKVNNCKDLRNKLFYALQSHYRYGALKWSLFIYHTLVTCTVGARATN